MNKIPHHRQGGTNCGVFINLLPPFGYFLFAKEEELFKRQRRGGNSKKTTRYSIPTPIPPAHHTEGVSKLFFAIKV